MRELRFESEMDETDNYIHIPANEAQRSRDQSEAFVLSEACIKNFSTLMLARHRWICCITGGARVEIESGALNLANRESNDKRLYECFG